MFFFRMLEPTSILQMLESCRLCGETFCIGLQIYDILYKQSCLHQQMNVAIRYVL